MATKAKAKNAPTCGAKVSGGALVCVLERGHAAAHSTAARGTKSAQHATWGDASAGGQITVTVFARGKRQSEWTEAGPIVAAASTCGAPARRGKPCGLDEGHVARGEPHSNGAITWGIDPCVATDAAGHACSKVAGHEGDHHNAAGWVSEADSDARWECGATFIGDDDRENRCEGRNDHNGPHYAWSKVLNRMVNDPAWKSDEELEDNDPHEDEIRSDEERSFSRRMREDREAHTAALESAAQPAMIMRTGETITCGGRVYKVHPAARLFPTPEKQYRELVESMRRDGQQLDVELLDEPGNPVIDGCSRLRACEELGIEPRTKIIHVAPGQHIRHVIAVNLARRHLDESQRAIAAADLATLEHGANQHSRGAANLPVLTQAQAAELLGVSERSVRDAVRVKNTAVPEVVEAVRAGRIKVSTGAVFAKADDASAQREVFEQVTKGNGDVRAGKVRSLIKQRQKREVVRKINDGQVPTIGMLTSGFGVALSDPAWPYDNSDQHDGSRGHIPYPGQPLDEIVRLHAELPSRMANDAILFLCYTNAFLLAVGDIARAGGWTFRTQLTIVKSRMGMGTWPRGRTEHVAILSRGNPVHTLNEVTTWLADKVIEMPREHSRKPDELYQVIEKHCGGPRLELYSRYARDGWSAWGAEADGAKATEPKRKSKIMTATDERARRRGAA
ncbi:MAG TPA: MT-A70 family methyltransferase [Kofleriaceae bacterium]|nr:MT-A70 family methyltransferase [Kofleriaceae bacterium]